MKKILKSTEIVQHPPLIDFTLETQSLQLVKQLTPTEDR